MGTLGAKGAPLAGGRGRTGLLGPILRAAAAGTVAGLIILAALMARG